MKLREADLGWLGKSELGKRCRTVATLVRFGLRNGFVMGFGVSNRYTDLSFIEASKGCTTWNRGERDYISKCLPFSPSINTKRWQVDN